MSVDRRWPAAGLAAGLAVALVLGGAAPTRGAGWEPLRQVCQVQDTDITENSGMSRSTYRRSVMFVHNDSGGGPRFFAIGTGCRTKAVFDVPGAPAKDWEDMASGPGHTLWFGDIGGSRDEVEVVVVDEPKSLLSRDLDFTSYTLSYPDGSHNAEAMMVRPGTGRLFIITKARTGAGIYRAPEQLSTTAVNPLTRVADAGQGLSGADFAPGGKRFVIRGYRTAFVYRTISDASPAKIPMPDAHLFGEAVMFQRSGGLIFGAEGVRQWLWDTSEPGD